MTVTMLLSRTEAWSCQVFNQEGDGGSKPEPMLAEASAPRAGNNLALGGESTPLYVERKAYGFSEVANVTEHLIIAAFSAITANCVVRNLHDSIIDEFTLTSS